MMQAMGEFAAGGGVYSVQDRTKAAAVGLLGQLRLPMMEPVSSRHPNGSISLFAH
jgi:hypothetical protein